MNVEHANATFSQLRRSIRIVRHGQREFAAFLFACFCFAAIGIIHETGKTLSISDKVLERLLVFLLCTGAFFLLYVLFRVSRQLIPPELPKPVSKPSAIKGPLSFGPNDADLFLRLGRNSEIASLLTFVLDDQIPVCVVRGVSGSGKTSFLRAGLGGALQARQIDFAYWEATPDGADADLLAAIRDGWAKADKPEHLIGIAGTQGAMRVVIIDQAEQLSPTAHRSIFDAVTFTVKQRPPYHLKWVVAFKRDYDSTWLDYEKSLPRFYPPYVSIEPFPLRQAEDCMAVIAEESGLTFDRQAVSELLASIAQFGLVSPVDIGIGSLTLSELAREQGFDHVGHAAFRDAGGTEGLLGTYVENRLNRLGSEKQETLRALWSFVDAERNERLSRGRTLAELETLMAMPGSRVQQIFGYLSSPQVRITEKVSETPDLRYRLSHERLIAALRVLSGNLLQDIERVSLLLDRRYRVWAGEQQRKFLLSFSELIRVLRYRGQLRGGEHRAEKEEYIRRSFKWRRAQGWAAILLLVVGSIAVQRVIRYEETRLQREASYLVTLRYAGSFPNEMTQITQTVLDTNTRLDISVDNLTYGIYSRPQEFERYRLALLERTGRAQVRILLYADDLVEREARSQFSIMDFEHIRQDPRFREFLYLHPGIGEPRTYDEFLKALRDIRHQFAEALASRGAAIRLTSVPTSLFVWIQDEKRAVFSLNDGENKSMSFVAGDTSLIRRFEELFNSAWFRGEPLKPSVVVPAAGNGN